MTTTLTRPIDINPLDESGPRREDRHRGAWAVLITGLALFMASLDNLVVTTASGTTGADQVRDAAAPGLLERLDALGLVRPGFTAIGAAAADLEALARQGAGSVACPRADLSAGRLPFVARLPGARRRNRPARGGDALRRRIAGRARPSRRSSRCPASRSGRRRGRCRRGAARHSGRRSACRRTCPRPLQGHSPRWRKPSA